MAPSAATTRVEEFVIDGPPVPTNDSITAAVDPAPTRTTVRGCVTVASAPAVASGPAEVVEPAELIRQCTVNAAKAFMAEGDFGVVAEGARADLLVVDGNPLDDINLLTRPETALLAIFKGGKVYKDLLG